MTFTFHTIETAVAPAQIKTICFIFVLYQENISLVYIIVLY